jgi:hypothetical protein
MGAQTKRSKPAKPLEDRKKAGKADSDRDWRTRATKGSDDESESDSGEEDLPVETRRRKLRVAEVYKDQEGESAPKEPEVPYRMVPEVVINVPKRGPPKGVPKERLQPQPQLAQPEEKLYRLRAPVQEDGLAKRIAEKLLDGEMIVKAREIAAVSNEVREEVRRNLTKVRKPITSQPKKTTMLYEEEDPFPAEIEAVMSLGNDALNVADLPRVEHVFVTKIATPGFPVGSVIVPDPVEQYLESLGPDETPRPVYAAKDAETLKVVYPMVQGKKPVEAVLDSGSQIVSMSYEQARDLGLVWDPDIQIYMQSANGALEKSVGLAKNVSFKFGDITVFLQVHIIDGPAYKILLGRPFEVLTESQFINKRDGSQIITLKDPVTGKRCSMPTINRGSKKPTVESVPDQDDQPARTADHSGRTGDFRPSSRS